MHPIMLRLPDALWEELKAAAEQEHRSVNGQIIWLIEEWLAERRAALAPPSGTPEQET